MDTITLFTILFYSGIPAKDAGKLVCIAKAESNLNPKAINHAKNRNKTKDYGLFQINQIWLKECGMSPKHLLDAHSNIGCAIYVYNKRGLKSWSTLKECQ